MIDKLVKNIIPPSRIEEECAVYEKAYRDFYLEVLSVSDKK